MNGGWKGAWRGHVAAAMILAASATSALAQAPSCRLPGTIEPARPIAPPADEAPRRGPVAGYLLALSWSPEYCRTRTRDPDDRLQCGSGNRFGFILHGLWPEGDGPAAPRWCRPAEALPPALVKQHLCATPSVALLQREWAKHGTCASRSAAGYLKAGSLLYGAVRYPDMDGMSRQRLTVGEFRRAFARANRGIAPDMLAIDTNPRGWLTEVRLCLDDRMRPRACPRHVRDARDDRPIRIWRGGR